MKLSPKKERRNSRRLIAAEFDIIAADEAAYARQWDKAYEGLLQLLEQGQLPLCSCGDVGCSVADYRHLLPSRPSDI